MKKNVNLNLNKNILFVTLAFVFFFCFVKVDCFAQTFSYVYGDIYPSTYNFSSDNDIYFYLVDSSHWCFVSPYSPSVIIDSYGSSISLNQYRFLYNNIPLYAENGSRPLSMLLSYSNITFINYNLPEYKDNLPSLHFEVFYNTPLLLRDSLVIKCMDRPLSLLDSYSKFNIELSEPTGSVFFSDTFYPNQFGNISGEVRVPGVFENIDFNGTVYYKITPYDFDGNWGNTILGSFQLGSSGSGEPLDNPYLTLSVDGIDIVGTVPVVSTTVQDKYSSPSTYLSPSNLPNVSYTTNNYYVYETNNTEEVDNLNNDYITYNINYSGSESTESGFGIIKNFFDDDFYKESNNVISCFSNMFPFISDLVVKPLSKIIALILGSTVVLIGVKIWNVLH